MTHRTEVYSDYNSELIALTNKLIKHAIEMSDDLDVGKVNTLVVMANALGFLCARAEDECDDCKDALIDSLIKVVKESRTYRISEIIHKERMN